MANSTDKSRNLLGTYEELAQNNPSLNFVMYFLRWFTVPVEVLFRRNFGERWFTTVNFYVGLLVLGFFTAMQETAGSLFGGSKNPFADYQGFGHYGEKAVEETPSFFERLGSHSMSLVLAAYVLFSMYHFFIIWWRNRTFTPVHSFSDGESRFQGIAYFLLSLINLAMTPIVNAIVRMMPEREKQKMVSDEAPPAFVDGERFADVFLEPLILLLLSHFTEGAMSRWLFISALATIVCASFKHTARLNKLLDIRDSSIDAEQAVFIKDWLKRPDTANKAKISPQQKALVDQIKTMADRTPEVAKMMGNDYPDLMDLIEDMNGKAPQGANATAASQEAKKPASMPFRQSEPSLEEIIAGNEKPPPPPAPPPPVYPPREERPAPVTPERLSPKTAAPGGRNLGNPPGAWLKDNGKTVIIAAGVLIGLLIVYFIVALLIKKTEAPAVPPQPEKTETPPAPKPAPSPTPTTPAKTFKGVIQTVTPGSRVNMHETPSEEGKPGIQLTSGDEVVIFRYGDETAIKSGEKGRWCRVAFRGNVGWVWGNYIREHE
jgi:hypothetical protein